MPAFSVFVAHPASARTQFQLVEALQRLEDVVQVEVNPSADQPLSAEALRERLSDVDALIAGWGAGPIPAEAYADARRLRLVAMMGSSLRPISPEGAWARGAVITNTARAVGESVAEYTLGLMLLMLHRFDRFDRAMKAGESWGDAQRSSEQRDLADQRVGLVGLGAVGGAVATRLRAMGSELFAFDPYASPERFEALGVTRCETVRDLFATCDIVSLHAGLTDATRHMVGEAELAAMRRGGLLINTGRGGLIDERALVVALREGRLTAALDVYEKEPLAADHPLRTIEGVVLSPHIAGFCNRSTYARCARTVVADVLRVARGEEPENVVTPEMHRRAT